LTDVGAEYLLGLLKTPQTSLGISLPELPNSATIQGILGVGSTSIVYKDSQVW
jgi:hypothetical protein